MEAARRGDVAGVRMHLPGQAGAADNLGATALMYAAQSGHLDAVALLADVEAGRQDWRGKTALIIAIQSGKEPIARYLVRYEAGIKDSDGLTALMAATSAGFIDLVHELSGTEARQADDTGKTALMYAAETDQLDAAKILVTHEAGIRDRSGQTALMYATVSGNLALVDLLRQYEAGICKDNGWSCLMTAAKLGNYEAAELLVESEAGLQKLNGMTALMVASQFDHEDIVRLLLPHESHLVRKDGQTAAAIATQFGNHEIASLLNNAPSIIPHPPPQQRRLTKSIANVRSESPIVYGQLPVSASSYQRSATYTSRGPFEPGPSPFRAPTHHHQPSEGPAATSTPNLHRARSTTPSDRSVSHQPATDSKLLDSYIMDETSQLDTITLNATMNEPVTAYSPSAAKMAEMMTEIDIKDGEIAALRQQVALLQAQLALSSGNVTDLKTDYVLQAQQLRSLADYMLQFAATMAPQVNHMDPLLIKKDSQ